MMKKLIILMVVLSLLSSFVLAKGPEVVKAFGDSEQRDGNNEVVDIEDTDNAEDQDNDDGLEDNQQTNNQGENQQLNNLNRNQVGADEIQGIKNRVQEKIKQINNSLEMVNKIQQKVAQNQNQVRLAVHTLLALENHTGGIGKNISSIARGFNNSLQATIKAEERIQSRSRITRFLIGGNEDAANELEEKINQNMNRVQELKEIKNNCDCSEEVLNLIQEQIQNMEQEQNRLQELAQQEKQRKGIFGWIFR